MASNPDVPAVHPFWVGVATNLSNPKAVLFFAQFFGWAAGSAAAYEDWAGLVHRVRTFGGKVGRLHRDRGLDNFQWGAIDLVTLITWESNELL
ncbi:MULTISPECIES: LysE family transporter [Corynebacterium]|uniref:LysE family transporter n=1 Tax=Corynebacterium TaxID=1716 RepID=UPI0020B1331D|nr:LysE family transporter [Corynebacterium hadale]WKC59002.1 hypothetical protein CHAD_00380 [Corynebacterium hadale]